MIINFDFPFYLTLGVVVTGIITLVDQLAWAKARKEAGGKQPKVIEYARSFFPALLIVWIIRSFIIQPYQVPTGSLEPTVMPGDFIAVNQLSYGIRFPVPHTKIFGKGEPKRGDVALFYWPEDTKVRFVKRVVGLPGDHVEYKNKILTVNGDTMPQQFEGTKLSEEPGTVPTLVVHLKEKLNGITHDIYVRPDVNNTDIDVVVPEGHYYMMGDNRDSSLDSRAWGFVPEENLIGKAFGVWMSWNSNLHKVRWNRIFTGIN